MDETFENLLVDYDGRRSLFKIGKLAILWELDRATGRFLAAHDLGYQTILDVHPETGAITYRPGMIPQEGVELEFCPSVAGLQELAGDGLPPGHPRVLRAAARQLRADHLRAGAGARLRVGGGVGISRRAHLMHPERPDGVASSSPSAWTGNVLWRHRTRTAIDSAALTTGGGLVVVGDWDREPVRARCAVGRDPVPHADAELGLRVPHHLRRRRTAVPGDSGGHRPVPLERPSRGN